MTSTWFKSLLRALDEQLHLGNENVLVSACEPPQTTLRRGKRAGLHHAHAPSRGLHVLNSLLHLCAGCCRACHVAESTMRVSIRMAESCELASQETVRRAEAAEQQRLKAEREAAEKRRQRLEAGFAQASLPFCSDVWINVSRRDIPDYPLPNP